MAKSTGLGKGVSDLLFGSDDSDGEFYFQCDIESIIPNKHQPRLVFNDDNLEELSESIKENGIIQPLIVSESKTSAGKYELIAGERRLRASKLAGLYEVPVVVKDLDAEETFLELAIIENVQRTDLNPIEEATAYKKLIELFGYTQEKTAKKVGKKRSTISNLIRLLKLPEYIQKDVSSAALTEGHARCLLRLIDAPTLMQEAREAIIKGNLSVRQTEKLVRKMLNSQTLAKAKPKQQKSCISDSYRKALINQLENRLSSKVQLHENGNRGTLEVDYYSLDDLERLIGIIAGDKV